MSKIDNQAEFRHKFIKLILESKASADEIEDIIDEMYITGEIWEIESERRIN